MTTEIEINENKNGNPEYLRASLYKPVSVEYRNIQVREFSENWKHFCVFTRENISVDDKTKLLDVESDGTFLDFEIKKTGFTIVSGLFEDYNGNVGTYIAKIDFDCLKVLQVKIIDENRDKIFYLKDEGDFCYIVKRLYSSAALIVKYEDISVIHKIQYD